MREGLVGGKKCVALGLAASTQTATTRRLTMAYHLPPTPCASMKAPSLFCPELLNTWGTTGFGKENAKESQSQDIQEQALQATSPKNVHATSRSHQKSTMTTKHASVHAQIHTT